MKRSAVNARCNRVNEQQPTAMENPDKDSDHARRRDTGECGESPDGEEIAERLYGGFTNTDNNTDSTGDASE